MAGTRKAHTRVPKALSRKKSRKTNKSLVLSKPMKELVDKRIDAHSETKCAIHHSGLIQVRAGRIIGTQLLRLLPDVKQVSNTVPGNRSSRIGAQIRLTSLEVEGVLTFKPNANFPNSGTQLVRIFAFSPKSVREWDVFDADPTLQTAVADAMLRNGADIADYDGNVAAHLLPVNHKDITSHVDRKFKINKSPQWQFGAPTGMTPLPISVVPFKFRLKVKDKVLKFTDAQSEFPTNYMPLIAIGWCDPVNNPQGQPPNTSTLDYQYQVKMNFKDD